MKTLMADIGWGAAKISFVQNMGIKLDIMHPSDGIGTRADSITIYGDSNIDALLSLLQEWRTLSVEEERQ